MRYFTNQNSITLIERQVYTGSLSSMTTTGVTATCYLRPLNEEQASVNGVQYGLGYSIIVETDVDIREGDRVTINSQVYTVRGTVNHNRGTFTSYKRILAVLPQQ